MQVLFIFYDFIYIFNKTKTNLIKKTNTTLIGNLLRTLKNTWKGIREGIVKEALHVDGFATTIFVRD